jgi:hypothetical protein
MSVKEHLASIQEQKAKLAIDEQVALQKAWESGDVDTIYKAQQYAKTIQARQDTNNKSILFDPTDMTNGLGYKSKGYAMSYDLLRRMSRTHIIKAIIETRKEQVSAFCQPQENKYGTGFVVQPRQGYIISKPQKKLTKAQEKTVQSITEFLLNCGDVENFWHADTFVTFVKKLVNDSLTFDQATAEVVRNRAGRPCEFFAVDGSTFRIADSYDENSDPQKSSEIIKGYSPSYVQVIDSNIVAEFYPWELMFGIRNPSTDIHANGYGRSELEDMIQTVTAILNSDYYNANFFKVGSAPKGMLRYSGNINENTVQEFKKQWLATMTGVDNMHKTPIVNADKLEFVNMHIPNKDMEFAKYQEFLIKISCALYKIDPSEIGFPMSGNSEGSHGLGGDNAEEKLKYSKDKGLKPLLKQVEHWINKYIVWQLDDAYEFRFVGIDGEATYEQELDQSIKRLGNFQTLNEIRAQYNLDPMEDPELGDIILNGTWYQAYAAKQMAAQQGNPFNPGDPNAPQGTGASQQSEEEDEEQGPVYNDNPFTQDQNSTDNPFMKGLQEDIVRILSTGK